jgi:isopentenyl-diphosphate delta-isomerase
MPVDVGPAQRAFGPKSGPAARPKVKEESVGPEFVVLLDDAGDRVGRERKEAVHHSETPLHLGFSCYVLDADDRLLVTRRALAKKTFPGMWTNSFCGHPYPGESLTAAARRRGLQELGLPIGDVITVLPSFRYRAELDGLVENEICPVTATRVETAARLSPEPGEVSDWDWVPWQAFARQVTDRSRTVSPWCREQVHGLARLGPPAQWEDASKDLPPTLRVLTDVPAAAGTGLP